MNTTSSNYKILGAAFLIQAITSLISGMIMKSLLVPGDIVASLNNVANNAWAVRVNIVGEMITAFGIVFLGIVLYLTFKKQNQVMASVALGFYILEAALLAGSRVHTFSLLQISQEYMVTANPALLTLGNLAVESMNFGYTLLMLAFGAGALMFYYLLYKSSVVPQALSLWGWITAALCLALTLVKIAGFEFPFFLYLPYAPFEFVVGAWILIKGIKIHESNEIIRPSIRSNLKIIKSSN